MNNIECERLDSLEGWVAVKSNIFEEAETFKLGFIVQWNVIECKFAVTCHNRTLQRQKRRAEVAATAGDRQTSWAGLFSVNDLKHVHRQLTCVTDILGTCFPDLTAFEEGNIWDLLFLSRRSNLQVDDERDFDTPCRKLEKYFSTAIDVCGRKIVLDTLFTQDERDVEEYFENLQEFRKKTMQEEMTRAKGLLRQVRGVAGDHGSHRCPHEAHRGLFFTRFLAHLSVQSNRACVHRSKTHHRVTTPLDYLEGLFHVNQKKDRELLGKRYISPFEPQL